MAAHAQANGVFKVDHGEVAMTKPCATKLKYAMAETKSAAGKGTLKAPASHGHAVYCLFDTASLQS
jgi:hypothetical protein